MSNALPHTLQKEMLLAHNAKLYTYHVRPRRPRKDNLTAIIMHGGGVATDNTSYEKFVELFANNGIAVVSLDFVGHGKTGGAMTDNSLAPWRMHENRPI